MSEHPMSGPRFETWLDRQIREAEERGAFDDLPGAGRPIADLDAPHDEMWWVKGLMRREGVGVTPPAIALRKRIEDFLDELARVTTEAAVRTHVARLNADVDALNRAPQTSSYVVLARLDVDDILARWRAVRAD